MKKPIHIMFQGDLYKVLLDNQNHIVQILCYYDNKNVKPDEVDKSSIDPALWEKINNQLLK